MMQNSLATQKALVQTGGYSLLSKLNKFLAGLIFFLAATQLGLHFWPSSSLVYGIRIDYLSPTIYFLDILIILFLVIKRSFLFLRFRSLRDSRRVIGTSVISILPILLTNLLYSSNPLSTLSWSLHFILYFSFLVALGSDLKGRAQPAESKAGRSDPKVVISVALTLSLLFQTILSLFQVYLGHSVGGLMYYFGERVVSVGSPGIALGTAWGTTILRAYGTFGHPNVLAGYAVISLLIILRLVPEFRSLRDSRRVIGTFATILATLIIFLTQSRSALIALFGLIIPFYIIKKNSARFLYFATGLLICLFVYPALLSPPRSDLSLSQRFTLQGLSLSVINSFPVFGTGAQASISTYPTVSPSMRLLQPDHNSLTLLLSWFGVIGIMALLSGFDLLFFVIKRSDLVGHPTRSDLKGVIKILLPLLPLLLLDHYLLTSPQGQFILLLYLMVAVN